MTYRYYCGECGLDAKLTMAEISAHHINCFNHDEAQERLISDINAAADTALHG